MGASKPISARVEALWRDEPRREIDRLIDSRHQRSSLLPYASVFGIAGEVKRQGQNSAPGGPRGDFVAK